MAGSRPAERVSDMRIAQIQSHVYSDKMKNVEQLERRLEERGILVFDTRLNGAVSFICRNQDELKIETFH